MELRRFMDNPMKWLVLLCIAVLVFVVGAFILLISDVQIINTVRQMHGQLDGRLQAIAVQQAEVRARMYGWEK